MRRTVRGTLALTVLAAASTACVRLPRPGANPGGGSGERSGGGAANAGDPLPDSLPPPAPNAEEDLQRLREAGPTYTPYETGPKLRWGVEAERLLTSRLLPVLREEELPARTRTLFWILVDPEGRVVEATVQTSSSYDAFDAAAREVALGLRYYPATAAGRAVPVWVVREISLLMK